MLLRLPLSSSPIPGPLTALALGLLCALPAAQDGPPGLVKIDGGRTKIGTPEDEVVELIKKHQGLASTLAGEYPQHRVEVDEFYLMPTEVTNEQFEAYVRDAGARPPQSWCAELDAARREHLEEQGRLNYEARQRGESYDRVEWDANEWWNENWETSGWKVPSGMESHPVNYVSHVDAEGYARWAGLRLMTEQEFTRAARGDGEENYPWGDEWEPERCNSQDNKSTDSLMPVGSFEGREGIHDLIGNVWEWTDSKYSKFKGYKPLEVTVSRGVRIKALADFDPSQRVVVGGAFVGPAFACRTSVRRGADRDDRAEALGFRCAASLEGAADAASAILDEEVERHLLPYPMKFAPDRAMARQRWESKPGSSKVDGYRVITKFQRLIFIPIEEQVDASSRSNLGRWTSDNGPLFLGVLSIPFAPLDPVMDGGTYYVAWRAADKVDMPDEDEEVSDNRRFWEAEGFDEDEDCFIFYDLSARPVVAIPSGPVAVERMKGGGAITVEPWVAPSNVDPDLPPPVPMDTLRFSIVLPAKSRKGVQAELLLKLKPDLVNDSWK